jgi:hypothetical protein
MDSYLHYHDQREFRVEISSDGDKAFVTLTKTGEMRTLYDVTSVKMFCANWTREPEERERFLRFLLDPGPVNYGFE